MATKVRKDRTDPKVNKSLAIRLVLEKAPNAKALEVAEAVKTEYGHKVTPTLVYLVKSKTRKPSKRRSIASKRVQKPAGALVASIKAARALLAAAGDVINARAVLDALRD